MSKFDNRPTRHIENEQGKGKDIFFTPAANVSDDKVNNEADDVDYDEKVRQTYYVTQQQKRALALMAAHEDMDKSEIVRAALDKYIPQNYMRMVLMK